jgi:hypothetical protein
MRAEEPGATCHDRSFEGHIRDLPGIGRCNHGIDGNAGRVPSNFARGAALLSDEPPEVCRGCSLYQHTF